MEADVLGFPMGMETNVAGMQENCVGFPWGCTYRLLLVNLQQQTFSNS